MTSDVAAPRTSGRERLPRHVLVVAAVVCGCVIVSHMFGRFTPSILLPAIRRDLVDSSTAAGVLGGTNFAGYIVGNIVVTGLARRTEPALVMRVGMAISAIALALLATAPTFGVLVVGTSLAGFGGAGIWITAPTLATADVPPHRRGAVLGALTASMGLAMLAISQGTTLYRRLVDDENAWRPIFGVEAVLTVAMLVALFVWVRPKATVRADAPELARPASAFSASALRSIPHWVPLVVAYTSFSALAGAWMQFLGLALDEDAGYSRAHINNLFSVFAVAAIFGPLAVGRLSDRIGRDGALAWATGASAVASVLLIVHAEPASAIAIALFGAGSFAAPIVTAAAVRDHLDNQAFASAFGIMTIVYGIGSFSAAIVAGVLADWRGSFDLVYVLLGLLAALSTAASLVRSRRLKGLT